MKYFFSLLCLVFALNTQAAVTKTVNVTTAGTLSSLLTADANTVTDLVITGDINAQDIKFIRNWTPSLVNLDLSGANIVAYTGTGGTYNGNVTYPANEMPASSFWNSYTGVGKTTLQSVILPISITSIGADAFYQCWGLSSIQIPALVSSIGDNAFAYCNGLTSVTIPNSVTTIGTGSFQYCSNLTTLTLGTGLTSIGESAFSDCTKLQTIHSQSITPPTLGNYCFLNDAAITKVYVPGGSLNSYKNADGWSDFFWPIIQSETSTAISLFTGDYEKVYKEGATIVIEGTGEGEIVSLYTITGHLVSTFKSQGETITLTPRTGQLYIVKTEARTFKVIL